MRCQHLSLHTISSHISISLSRIRTRPTNVLPSYFYNHCSARTLILVIFQLSHYGMMIFIILSIRLFTPIDNPSLPFHFMPQHQYAATDIGRQSHRPASNESLFFYIFTKNLMPIIQYVCKIHLRIFETNTVKRTDQKSAESYSARFDY